MNSHKAIICEQYSAVDNLVFKDVPSSALQCGEVRIQSEACGVNFPDALMVEGKYQVKPELPFTPGFEVAGTISEVADDVSDFNVGERVVAFLWYGAFAEQVIAPQQLLIKLPEHVSSEQAAAMLVTYGTAYHALKQRAQLQNGETLLVLGAAGGVGLAAVELGKAMGATVIAAASSEEKLALCQKQGVDYAINYTEQSLKDEVKKITEGKGADVIFDPVGGELFDQCCRAINFNGRLLCIGFASGEIPKLPVNLALVKSFSVVGVFWGRFCELLPELQAENMQELFTLLQDGKIFPHIDERLALREASRALKKIQAREVKGKLLLIP